jgi:hypothetical protein
VKTVSEGQFTLAKGIPVSGEKLEKYNSDKNTQKAAHNVKQKVKSINQKQTHNFSGAKAKVNLMSTPTKSKEGGGGGGSVQSLLQLSPNLAEQSMEKVRPNEGGVLIRGHNGIKLHIISFNFRNLTISCCNFYLIISQCTARK